MPELFDQMSALAVFLILAALGFAFLLVSLVFGELFEQLGFGGHFDGLADGPGLLDSRVVGVFVTTFGGAGAICTQMGMGALSSSLVGLAAGTALGLVVSLFARLLYSQQASSSVSAAQLVGRTAQVTVKIPAGGIGQVSCRVGEERVEKLARARDNVELAPGMLVRIEEFAGDSAIVAPAGELPDFSSRA